MLLITVLSGNTKEKLRLSCKRVWIIWYLKLKGGLETIGNLEYFLSNIIFTK